MCTNSFTPKLVRMGVYNEVLAVYACIYIMHASRTDWGKCLVSSGSYRYMREVDRFAVG